MTDPNQNNPQNPGDWSQNPYAPGGGFNQPPQQPQQPGAYPSAGQQPGPYGQQNMYGPGGFGNQSVPGGPGGPGVPGGPGYPGIPGGPGVPGYLGGPTGPTKKSSGPIVAIAVVALVAIIIIAVALLFVLRKDDDNSTVATSTSARSSGGLDDTLTGSGSNATSDSSTTGDGDNSLSPTWSSQVPASVVDHLELCQDTTFDVQYIDDSTSRTTVDGASCYTTDSSILGTQRVDILSNSERVRYIESVLNGQESGTSGEVFRHDGSVTLGVSDLETPGGVTLFYIDTSSNLSVEFISFDDAATARLGANELGLL